MFQSSLKRTALILAALGASGCATTSDEELTGGLFGPALSAAELDAAIAKAAASPLGSAANPVRVNMPPGERAYLGRLRCGDGKAPEFDRSGSTGVGPYGNILDLYAVTCPGSAPASSEVHLDMYHADHVELRPVAGFTIAAP